MSNGQTAGQQDQVTPLAKPVVVKQHFHLADKASAAFLYDLSAYPGLTYAEILRYPNAELIKKYGIT